MDVQMPEMDGFETTAAIRDEECLNGRHLPIIAMTAHALKDDRERCLAAGMDGYLAKPLTSRELLAVLATIPAAPAAAEVFDLTRAMAGVDGSLDFLREMCALLDKEAPRLIAGVRDAVEDHDALKLERAAHRLKGSLLPFAAHLATQAAESLETMGRTRDLSSSFEEFHVVDVEVQRLLTAIKDCLPLPKSDVSVEKETMSCPLVD